MLFAKDLKGSLTVLVINNNGGGIFEHLPISKRVEFEKCFATPQTVDLEALEQGSWFGIPKNSR